MQRYSYIFFSLALLIIGITPIQVTADPCQKYIDAYALTSSNTGSTALECYNKLRAQDPNNPTALAGLKKIEDIYGTFAHFFQRN